MNQLKSVLVITFLLVFTLSYGQGWGKGIKGNGKISTETRNVDDYDGVKCAGFMDFKLVKGTEGKVTIEGESNLLEYIVTEVKNGNLVVKIKTGKNLKPSKNSPIIITIPYESINSVSLSGSGDVWNEGVIETSDFNSSLSGSGDVVLHIATESVKSSVSGSGDLTLKGSTKNLDASVTGSGDFHGFNLKSTNVDVSVTGSGDADVVCNGELKARVTGSGDIEYRGNPTKEDTKVIGSGSIQN